jgi:hypothetical protein
MPVNVTGVKQLQKAMRDVDKDLNKEMSKNIKQAMLIVRDRARDYLPAQNDVLSGWGKGTGSLETVKDPNRLFPPYDYAYAKSKVAYSAGQNKANNRGFKAAFYVYNNSRSGAIFETAGRINRPRGNKSLNPNAPAQFNAAAEMLSSMKGQGKQRGRVIYRAWDETKNKVIPAVVGAIDTVAIKFKKDTEIRKAA